MSVAMRATGAGPRAALVMAACFIGSAVFGQEPPDDPPVPEELELTMTLMPANAELPEAVTKTIELPASAAPRGAEASEAGRERAGDARANRQEGLDTAAEARERGLEFGEAMAEQARENREDAGRGDPPATPPDGPPDDLPGPPDL